MNPDLGMRFEDPQRLGQGEMGQVWSVLDRSRGQRVALKAMAGDLARDPELRLRFRQEFQLLRQLRHERIVQVLDWLELPDGQPAYTMELLSGAELSAPLAIEQGERLLVEALEALAFVHGRGYLHGDLKPENLRLGEDSHLRLVDFGLLERIGHRAERVRGTPLYLAPETARGDRLDGRADLYALGAVFYHLLAGQPPFDAASLAQTLRAHAHQQSTPLAQHRPDLPETLSALVDSLLAKLPSDRPASAAAALARLGVKARPAALVLAPRLVGRQAEIDAIERALSGPGQALAVSGAVGAGKTLLLDELAARGQDAGQAVLRLDGAAQPELVGQLRRRYEAVALATRPAAPWQAWFEPPAELDPASALHCRLAACRALVEAALGPRVWWVIDDADRLDEPSQQVLDGLRRSAPDGWRFLTSHALGRPAELVLGALDDEAVEELTVEMLALDRAPSELVAELGALTDALPGRLTALLRSVSERMACHDGRLVEIDELRHLAEGLAGPSALEAGPLARELAGLLALWRRPIDAWRAARWLGLDEPALAEAMAELVEKDVLVVGQDGLRLASGASAAIAAGLEAGERARLHAAIARGLLDLAAGPERDLERFDPLVASDQPAEALAASLGAIDALRARYALQGAERIVAWVLAREGLEPGWRAAALERLGDLHRLAGRIPEAEQAYREALSLVAPTARLLTNLALTRQMQSDFDEARRLALQALALAPEGAEAARAGTTLARLDQLQGLVASARRQAQAALEAAKRSGSRAFEAEALGLLGYLAIAGGEPSEQGLAQLERALAIREALGDQVGLNDAYMFLGNAHLAGGRFGLARPAFERNLQLCRAIGAAENDSITALINLGLVDHELGELDRSAERLELARQRAVASRDRFLGTYALALQARLDAALGRLDRAHQRRELALQEAEQLDNDYLRLACLAFGLPVLRALGDELGAYRQAEAALELSADKQLTEFDGMLALEAAHALLSLEETERAEQLLADHQAAWHSHAAGALRARALADLLAIRAPSALLAPGWLAEAREQGLGPLVAELELERARLLRAAGQTLEGVKAAQSAHAQAWALGMELTAHLALLLLDEPQAAAQAQRALERMASGLPPALERRFRRRWRSETPALRADRVGTIVSDFGRMVTGTLSYEEVLDRVIDQVMAITGAERGMIMLVDPQGALSGLVVRPQTDPDQVSLMSFSRSFVDAALAERRSVWSADAQNDERFAAAKSIFALDLRSVLCVPLIVEDAAIGLLYVDRQSVNREFSEADLRLVEGLAGFAGLAIANARRFEQTQERARLLGAMQELAQLASRRLDRSSLYDKTLEQALVLTGAQRGWIVAGSEPVCVRPGPAEGPWPAEEVERTARTAEPATFVWALPQGGHLSGLIAPLVVEGRVAAVLCLASDTEVKLHSPGELAVVEAVAHHAASALEVQVERERQHRLTVELAAALERPPQP